MPRLINADALDDVLDEIEGLRAHAAFTDGIMVARRELALAPTIDAVPVVRCKDCELCVDTKYGLVCDHTDRNVPADGFCHAGLRAAHNVEHGHFLKMIENAPTIVPAVTGDTSDGYHTFNELYHHRAVLFSVIVNAFSDRAWKSRQHSDGTMFDGMFIVGIETPDGQATYHYDIDPYWDMFQCKELECAPEWDGHTAEDAIERIGKLEPVRHGRWIPETYSISKCSACGQHHFAHAESWNYCPNCGAKMDLEVQDDTD